MLVTGWSRLPVTGTTTATSNPYPADSRGERIPAPGGLLDLPDPPLPLTSSITARETVQWALHILEVGQLLRRSPADRTEVVATLFGFLNGFSHPVAGYAVTPASWQGLPRMQL